MSKLSISNVVRVSLLQALRGLPIINTSALALITDDVPIPSDYGVSRVYRDSIGVGDDFGTNSDAYRIAQKVFSQSPNIISGGGFLVIIPRIQAASASSATIISSNIVDLTALVATDYAINVNVDIGGAADVAIGELDLTDLSSAEDSLNSYDIESAGLVFELSGELSSCQVTLKAQSTGVASTIVIGTALAGVGTDIAPLLNIAGSAAGTDAGLESIKDTILRTNGAVDYFGIIYDVKLTDAEVAAVAPIVQSIDKIQFLGSSLTADIVGIYTTGVKDLSYTATRCLLYTLSVTNAIDFAAGYASRSMSVDFDVPGTALTMNLKDINGFLADSGITQTIADSAKAAGVDIYPDFGIPKTYTSGANLYFDQVYNRLAFKLRLQVAGFNFLATTSTKIPQTESGLSSLKAAYRGVCDLFITAGVFAPGAWNGETFGNPEDFIRNIADDGFYVYSLPITQQSQADREARVAPLVQIAAKEAGAIHSSNVIVSIEA